LRELVERYEISESSLKRLLRAVPHATLSQRVASGGDKPAGRARRNRRSTCDPKPVQTVLLRINAAAPTMMTARQREKLMHRQLNLIATYSSHQNRADLLKRTRRQ
jgi:hypothetical protein